MYLSASAVAVSWGAITNVRPLLLKLRWLLSGRWSTSVQSSGGTGSPESLPACDPPVLRLPRCRVPTSTEHAEGLPPLPAELWLGSTAVMSLLMGAEKTEREYHFRRVFVYTTDYIGENKKYFRL